MLVAEGGLGLTNVEAEVINTLFRDLSEIKILLLTGINWSSLSFSLLIGSTPFSAMYFSINRLSKMHPETGDMTGCSGTSLLTEK